MIIINNILLLFYNFLDYKCICIEENNYYFLHNNYRYILKEIKQFDDNIISSIKDNRMFHKIILNKYGNVVSNYNEKKYVLLKIVYTFNNRKIKFDDLLAISKININFSPYIKNYYNAWLKKIDFLELYIKENKITSCDFEYFLGLSEIATNIIKKIDLRDVKYGLSYNRFNNYNLYNILDPFNAKYIPIITGFSEYIKYVFIKEHNKVSYKKIFDLDLSINDYLLFISRLLLPTYYFDLFINNDMKNSYLNILSNIDYYIVYIKEIIYELKKRHNNVPFIDYIINQF